MRKCLIRGDNEVCMSYSDKFNLELGDFLDDTVNGDVLLWVTQAREGKTNRVRRFFAFVDDTLFMSAGKCT